MHNINSKKIDGSLIYAIVGFVILIFSIIGSIVAFFTSSSSDNNSNILSGNQITTDITNGIKVENSIISFELTKLSLNANSKVLVPIERSTSMLTNASRGWDGSSFSKTFNDNYACIDKNGSAVCKTYQLKINNKTNEILKFNAGITSLSGIDNIDVINMASNISVTSINSIKENSTGIANNISIAANSSNMYYFMVFIDDIGTNKNDSNSFIGTIAVSTFDSIITGIFS